MLVSLLFCPLFIAAYPLLICEKCENELFWLRGKISSVKSNPSVPLQIGTNRSNISFHGYFNQKEGRVEQKNTSRFVLIQCDTVRQVNWKFTDEMEVIYESEWEPKFASWSQSGCTATVIYLEFPISLIDRGYHSIYQRWFFFFRSLPNNVWPPQQFNRHLKRHLRFTGRIFDSKDWIRRWSWYSRLRITDDQHNQTNFLI